MTKRLEQIIEQHCSANPCYGHKAQIKAISKEYISRREVVEELEKCMDKLPKRDGQEKSVMALIQNWKECIEDLDALIKKINNDNI